MNATENTHQSESTRPWDIPETQPKGIKKIFAGIWQRRESDPELARIEFEKKKAEAKAKYEIDALEQERITREQVISDEEFRPMREEQAKVLE
jgi:hypothetical protein